MSIHTNCAFYGKLKPKSCVNCINNVIIFDLPFCFRTKNENVTVFKEKWHEFSEN